ncbi:MAG TPA: hypothetical protein VF486_25760 [Actinomycetes bacterium]
MGTLDRQVTWLFRSNAVINWLWIPAILACDVRLRRDLRSRRGAPRRQVGARRRRPTEALPDHAQEVAMPSPKPQARTQTVLAAAGLSWLGLFVHNIADLPGQTPLSPETAYPAVALLLIVVAWLSVARRAAAWLLLGWGWLHLVGGAVLSVLPIPLWPFQPPQTLRHYAFHALYGVLQAPLLIVTTRYVRQLRARHPARQ